MKKIIFLACMLAIPVSIFSFLKFFGSNSFEVPILYPKGNPQCTNEVKQHIIPNKAYFNLENELNYVYDLKGYVMFSVLDGSKEELYSKSIKELVRIQDAFYEVVPPDFLIFLKGTKEEKEKLSLLLLQKGMNKEFYQTAFLEENELNEFLNCGLGISDQNDPSVSFVLSDPLHRIRGIYNSLEVEETDKLILELMILKRDE